MKYKYKYKNTNANTNTNTNTHTNTNMDTNTKMQTKNLTNSQVSLHYINTMMSMRGVMEVQCTTSSSQESLVSAVDIGTF